MRLDPRSLPNIQRFNKNPDNYIIRARYTQNGVAVDLMKKGFLTWVKIHVGGLLGRFDQTSVKMQNVWNRVSRIPFDDADVFQFRFLVSCKLNNNYLNKHREFFFPIGGVFHDPALTQLVAAKNLVGIEAEFSNRIKKGCSRIAAFNFNGGVRIKLTSSEKVSKPAGSTPLAKLNIVGLFDPLRGKTWTDEAEKIFQLGHKRIFVDLSLDENKDCYQFFLSAE